MPLGPISTGISGIPFLARDEKVRDITEVFEANPNQEFVMFGDSSHVDPDAYRIILEDFEAQVHVAFIHDVKTIEPTRLVGLFLIDNYAQAAAELMRLEFLSEDEARMVMNAVVAGGEIDAQGMEDLIAANQP
ncbi:MAG: App1 family protein [Myxococcales bacterium]|nr:App1 family protein [Myxococcales bacterium]